MADDIAEAFKRYWLIIIGVVGLCLSAGQILVNMQTQQTILDGRMDQYENTRTLLLDKIDSHFARVDQRLDKLEREQ